MATGPLFFITIWLSALLFLYQRTEVSRRRFVLILLLVVGFLTQYWAAYRGLAGEFWLALVIALVFNFAFWLLIGRYNPVGSSDEIEVMGMDD
jgi:hypothetical protein